MQADADGATEFSALADLYQLVRPRQTSSRSSKSRRKEPEQTYDMAIGSR